MSLPRGTECQEKRARSKLPVSLCENCDEDGTKLMQACLLTIDVEEVPDIKELK